MRRLGPADKESNDPIFLSAVEELRYVVGNMADVGDVWFKVVVTEGAVVDKVPDGRG